MGIEIAFIPKTHPDMQAGRMAVIGAKDCAG